MFVDKCGSHAFPSREPEWQDMRRARKCAGVCQISENRSTPGISDLATGGEIQSFALHDSSSLKEWSGKSLFPARRE
jgi:hypothetical protein